MRADVLAAASPAPVHDAVPALGRPRTNPAPVTVPPVTAPHIVWDPIPFGPERKAQMVAYVRRHYGSFMKPT